MNKETLLVLKEAKLPKENLGVFIKLAKARKGKPKENEQKHG